MELRWLEDFITLARTRHFSRAAESRNVAQPTFSRRIKLLEEEMGTTLINRQTLPLSLTPAGEEFLGLCHDITRRLDEGRRRLAQLSEQQTSHLRLAAPQSLLVHFLPSWRDTLPAIPALQPYLRATGWLVDDYFRALARRECDLVLCYWPLEPCGAEPDIQAFASCSLAMERLVPVTVPDARGQPLHDLETGTRLPLIAYHPRGLIDAAIRHRLGQLDQFPTFSVLSENIQSGNIRELVIQGYGVGWLPERTVRDALADGSLVPAGGERWRVPLEIRLFRRSGGDDPVDLDTFWESLARLA